jgi:ABC-type phosphate transport system permease subunit
MTTFEATVWILIIALCVIAPYLIFKLSRTPRGRVWLRVCCLAFGVQLVVLFGLFLVEYDKLGHFDPLTWTFLRILCWLGSLGFPYATLFCLLYRSPPLGLKGNHALRAITLGIISLPLTILSLIAGHIVFSLAGYGLIFD